MNAAPLYEVFSSVQGEATRVGERHLFVRFAGCDLECAYCDTPASRRIPGEMRVFFPGGVHAERNPVTIARLDELTARLDAEAGPHHAVSVTGGEPLLFADMLAPLARGWRARGWTVLLETGGHRPDDLARVLPGLDVVMADVKIRSSAGFATAPETVRAFLALAARVECAVKVVVSADTTAAEIDGVLDVLPHREVPLVLQPVTGARFRTPSGDHLLALQRAAMARHPRTRVIPQTHKSLHVR